jgi:hypothetical protein
MKFQPATGRWRCVQASFRHEREVPARCAWAPRRGPPQLAEASSYVLSTLCKSSALALLDSEIAPTLCTLNPVRRLSASCPRLSINGKKAMPVDCLHEQVPGCTMRFGSWGSSRGKECPRTRLFGPSAAGYIGSAFDCTRRTSSPGCSAGMPSKARSKLRWRPRSRAQCCSLTQTSSSRSTTSGDIEKGMPALGTWPR